MLLSADQLTVAPLGIQLLQLQNVEALSVEIHQDDPENSSVTVLDPKIQIFAGGQQPVLSVQDVNILNEASAPSVQSDVANIDESSVTLPDSSQTGEEGLLLSNASVNLGSTLEVQQATVDITRSNVAQSLQNTASAFRSTFSEDGLRIALGTSIDNLAINAGGTPMRFDVQPGEATLPSEGQVFIPTVLIPQLAPVTGPIGAGLESLLLAAANTIQTGRLPPISIVQALKKPDTAIANSVVTLGTFALNEMGIVSRDISTTQRQIADVTLAVINNSKETDMTAVVFDRIQQGPGGDNLATRAAEAAGIIAGNLQAIDPASYAPAPPPPDEGDPVEQSPEQQFASDMQAAFEAGNPATGGSPEDGFAAGSLAIQNFAGQIMDDTAGVAVQLAEAVPSLAADAVGNVDGTDDGADPGTDFGTFVDGPDGEDGFGEGNAFSDMDVIGTENDVLTIADGVLGFPAEVVAAAAGGGGGGEGPAPSLVKGLVPADAAFASAFVEGVERAFTGVDEGLNLFVTEYNAGTDAFLTSIEERGPEAGQAFFTSRAPGGSDELAPRIQAILEGEAYTDARGTPDQSNPEFVQGTLEGAPGVIMASLQGGGAPVGGDPGDGPDPVGFLAGTPAAISSSIEGGSPTPFIEHLQTLSPA